jgi:hypothetical protein
LPLRDEFGEFSEKDLPIGICHSTVDVQECERSITALESARALVIINCGASEGVFENPVGTSFGSIQTLSGAVAGRVDAIFVIQVDHGNDTGDVDAVEVSNTSSIVRWSLELREHPLGDLALADGVVIVPENLKLALEGKTGLRRYLLVGAGEDVDI